MKRLIILAGANGSGKSTISRVLLAAEQICYVNPDDIARELSPKDPVAVKVQAGKIALRKVCELLIEGKSFVIESTLSGVTYLKTIKRARDLGYMTTIIYVFVDSPDACIARIASRVKNGGHPVPDCDIRRRYLRSKVNFWYSYAGSVDNWMLFYNGENSPVLVARQENGASIEVLSPMLMELFKEGLCQTM